MKKMKLLIAVVGMLALASVAFGAEIADIAWDQSNLETLRSFTDSDVARFLISAGEPLANSRFDENITAGDIQEFAWANLFGDQQYQLVVVGRPAGSGGVNDLTIYTRNSAGKINVVAGISARNIRLEGWENRPYIPKVIQDLDGDGKDELVIPAQLGYGRYGAAPVAIWPQVYRLKDGQYVEASRDFAKFYDTQVLPELNRGIAATRERAAREAQEIPGDSLVAHGQKMWLDKLIMARDKILRVIGRDPEAGLKQAREWLTDPVPDPGSATSVFHDIGDHEEDVRAARAVLQRWSEEQKAAGLSK